MGGHFVGSGGCKGSASGALNYNENEEDKYPKSNKAGVFFLPLLLVLPPLIFRGKKASGDGESG